MRTPVISAALEELDSTGCQRRRRPANAARNDRRHRLWVVATFVELPCRLGLGEGIHETQAPSWLHECLVPVRVTDVDPKRCHPRYRSFGFLPILNATRGAPPSHASVLKRRHVPGTPLIRVRRGRGTSVLNRPRSIDGRWWASTSLLGRRTTAIQPVLHPSIPTAVTPQRMSLHAGLTASARTRSEGIEMPPELSSRAAPPYDGHDWLSRAIRQSLRGP